jgi:hypothetical protein
VRAGRHAVILPNGNLGYNGNHPRSPDRYAPWSMWHGGDFYEVTPDGEVVWRHEDPDHHHDAQWLANGHLLYAACAPVPAGFAERVPGGTAHGPGETMYGDVIREVDRSGRLVWEWKAWEHLAPEDFPIHPGFGRYHWPLVNGLGVRADGTAFMGNAQRLWNGNTHITESATGRLFEVTPAGEVVWEYILPWFAEYPDAAARRTGPGRLNSVFQTWRYPADQLPWLGATGRAA